MSPIDDEELERPSPVPPKLETLGVQELQDYIEKLRAEIGRAEAMIKSKQSVRSGAEALFKKQG